MKATYPAPAVALLGTLLLSADESASAVTVPCSISALSGNYLHTNLYEYFDRSTVCYDGGALVFAKGGATATLVGRARCTDDGARLDRADYEIPVTVRFDKSHCAATLTFDEGDQTGEIRIFFDKSGSKFRGSFYDTKGVGNFNGERQ